MNTELQNSSTAEANANSVSRRNGNVARLPKPIRDKINSMLDDGITYAEIITALGEHGKHLQISNISRWKDGGYQDYLRNQAWRERIDTRADRYLEVAANDAPQLVAGSLYAATLEISELMDDLAKTNADDTDATKLARISHALARLSQTMLNIQEYRDKLAKQKAADPESPEAQHQARLKLVAKVDELFGLSSGTSEARVKKIFPLAGDNDYAKSLDHTAPQE